MKIPLTITSERVIATAHVKYKRVFGYISFFVDTGSDVSFISTTDAFRLKLSPTTFPFKRNIIIGGSSLALKKMEKVLLTFKTERLKREVVNCPEFLIAQALRKKDKTAQSVPSILGLAFLKEHKLALHVNPSGSEAYLEKK